MPPDNLSKKADSLDAMPSIAEQPPDMVEIRPAGSMGNGLFATQDIPRGTRIIAEAYIVSIPSSFGFGKYHDCLTSALYDNTCRKPS
ncbi:Uu.00g143430.m01.CDS01 [Anthostomella pinea]|uniref:Uu.00g143430.m01.CDS01 n=1 Tax=Anthostomella pinea TaxID=933095 RepID=A0AAI8YLM6_9PEZI|nr:Uu.00g143430.m01.CDS01 [Anthostomella pinea]